MNNLKNKTQKFGQGFDYKYEGWGDININDPDSWVKEITTSDNRSNSVPVTNVVVPET